MFFERPAVGQRVLLVSIEPAWGKSASGQGAAARVAIPGRSLELRELAESAAMQVAGVLALRLRDPHPKWYLGSGQLQRLTEQLKVLSADLVVFDSELKPNQQRNLERHLNCRLLTRTELILEIFAQRARTHEGQLQVELAQLTHAQTRLVKGWTHLDRQKGGIGLRGAGEKQLELDQRLLARRIDSLRQRLDAVRAQRSRGRRRRQRNAVATVTLVGYTNAGKSTLFNRLTRSDVHVQDQLFATLDPTLRKLEIAGAGTVVLADTVGFIRALPHGLVEAFKATLEEVASADLLLHVMDASAQDLMERREQVLQVLQEIGAAGRPLLDVYNKSDLLGQPCSTGRNRNGQCSQVWVSATKGTGIDQLTAAIARRIGVPGAAMRVLLSPLAGRTRSWLYRLGAVLDEKALSDGQLELTVRLTQGSIARLQHEPGVMLQSSQSLGE